MKDFTQLPNLASERLGGRTIDANDDFFAAKENLVKDSKPVFIEGKYTDRGKWMDGWETRRRRTPGHDWCIVRLGLPGVIRGIVVDTSFFTGNYPERFSLEGCNFEGKLPVKSEKKKLSSAQASWVQILPETVLKGDTQNKFSVTSENRFTHLRLRIFPDGGVARLRVHGEVIPDVSRIPKGEIDLVAVENGGSVVNSSDQFYGAPGNLLMSYRAKNMGDGWETKRRRGPGNDWVVLKLGMPSTIRRIEVDTTHFKGNYPDSCSLEAYFAENPDTDDPSGSAQTWKEILPETKLKANYQHVFKKLRDAGPVSHVRFQIYPDGGVSRLKLFGRPENVPAQVDGLKRFNRLPRSRAVAAMLDCCGTRKWAEQMAEKRPFANVAQLFATADKIWPTLEHSDWLEAFKHHPAIGESRAKTKQSATASRWSANEQSKAQTPAPDVFAALADGNKAYAKQFGYVFLICATGKSSEEILRALQQRMANSAETELGIAAEEQRKITGLRLEKLLQS
jgi:allantoicase